MAEGGAVNSGRSWSESNNTAASGSGSDLDEEPGGDQGQAAVLAVKAVVVGVEGKVVEIEEPGKESSFRPGPWRLLGLAWVHLLTSASDACWCWCGSRWRRTDQPTRR